MCVHMLFASFGACRCGKCLFPMGRKGWVGRQVARNCLSPTFAMEVFSWQFTDQCLFFQHDRESCGPFTEGV